MSKRKVRRLAGFSAGMLLTAFLTIAAAEEPCYGLLDDQAVCPSLTPSGTCEQQGNDDLLGCFLGDYVYHERTTGPYKCNTAPKETGKKCVPVVDEKGVVQTEKQGERI